MSWDINFDDERVELNIRKDVGLLRSDNMVLLVGLKTANCIGNETEKHFTLPYIKQRTCIFA